MKKVLIVEDNKEQSFLLQEILDIEISNAKIDVISDYKEFKDLIKEIIDYQIVILDNNLDLNGSEYTGYQVAQALDEVDYKGKIIIYSGDNEFIESKNSNSLWNNLLKNETDKRTVFIEKGWSMAIEKVIEEIEKR
jgi:DNA-binding NtrC family response regulator